MKVNYAGLKVVLLPEKEAFPPKKRFHRLKDWIGVLQQGGGKWLK